MDEQVGIHDAQSDRVPGEVRQSHGLLTQLTGHKADDNRALPSLAAPH